MGGYDATCMECDEEHIEDGDVCNVVICKLVWKRKGAEDLHVPRCLKAIYGGYGEFDPVDPTLAGKIALFDADAVDARGVKDLVSYVPAMTDYIFSIVAAAESCDEAHEMRQHPSAPDAEDAAGEEEEEEDAGDGA